MTIPSISFLLLGITLTYTLRFLYRLYLHRRFFRTLPGPPHHWLLGHLPVLASTAALFPPNCHPQIYLTTIAHKYDLQGIFYIDIWPISDAQCIILDPALQDQVTVTKSLAMHDMAEDFLRPVLGKGVIAAANGEMWKRLHSAMSPAFAWAHVRSLVPVMVEEIRHFRAKLDQLANSGEVFSMEDVSSRLIFDVIGRVVFNEKLDAQGERGSQILSDLKEMVKLAEAGLSMNPVVKLKAKLRKRAVLGRLHPVLQTRVQERYARLRKEGKVPSRKATEAESVLDLMLREQLQRDQQRESGTMEAGISKEMMESLMNNMKGLLVGGHGTTTDTLCYAYTMLSNNLDAVERMRKEQEAVFGTSKFEEIVQVLESQPGKLGELPYTTAVINETLRLFPVGFSVRVAPDSMTLQHSGFTYPLTHPSHGGKGKMVVIPMGHYVHYSSNHFDAPDSFKPERWLTEDGVPRSCFRTFGRGSRACLGQRLAMDELRMVLLATVREWNFEYIEEETTEGKKSAKKGAAVSWTKMDQEYGHVVWQELGIEAKPRGGVLMKVRKQKP